MGVGRAQHLEMSQPVDGYVHGVAGVAGDDVLAEWIGQAGAAGFSRGVLFGRVTPLNASTIER